MHLLFAKTRKLLGTLLIVFGLSCVLLVILSALLWQRVHSERVSADAIRTGDQVLAGFINEVSKTAYVMPQTLNRLTSNVSFKPLFNPPELSQTDQVMLVREVGDVLRLHTNIVSIYIYDNAQQILLRMHRSNTGEVVVAEVPLEDDVRDVILHGTVMEDGEIYMSKSYPLVDPRTGEASRVISYARPVRGADGSVLHVVLLSVGVSSFFTSFDQRQLPGSEFFVADAEGDFLYHDPRRSEKDTGTDPPKLFSHFPEGYPDILAGRGERRVRDGGDHIQVRTLHPAFDVVVDGARLRINTQDVPIQHRAWFIGYRE